MIPIPGRKKEEYKDGYDMNTFTINGTRLAKVIGQYSHVFMTDRALVSKFAKSFNIPEANADGCICIFWPAHTQKHFTLFTRRMILESQFVLTVLHSTMKMYMKKHFVINLSR